MKLDMSSSNLESLGFVGCAHVSGIGGSGAGNLDVSAAGTFKSFSLLTWIFRASALIFCCRHLPVVSSNAPPRGEIIDDIHKDGDASTSVGHLSEKSMSWQDWENSFMAFKAFFDGGVTHSMKSSHGSVSFETIGCMDL
ncbi:unnamed protein product [Prunus brigantina]